MVGVGVAVLGDYGVKVRKLYVFGQDKAARPAAEKGLLEGARRGC